MANGLLRQQVVMKAWIPQNVGKYANDRVSWL